MKLTFQERYDILNSREKSLALPVAFLYPTNSAPGEPEFEESVKRYNDYMDIYRNDQSHDFWEDYPVSKLTLGDLDGKHIWRNIYIGRQLITLRVGPAQWSGWLLRPSDEDWHTYWESPLNYYGDRWCADHWVLCDELTADQVQAWEVFRKTQYAIREAHLTSSHQVQIKLF